MCALRKYYAIRKTKIVDKDGNTIFVSMFNYIVDKNMFFATGEIKIIDDRSNEYYFSAR